MNTPYVVKVAAAFLVGIVVALGGALIYVRSTELPSPQPVAQAAPLTQVPPMVQDTVPPASNPPLPQKSSEEASATQHTTKTPPQDQTPTTTAPKWHPKPHKIAADTVAPAKPKQVSVVHPGLPQKRTIQIAQNRHPTPAPLAEPLNAPASAAATNDRSRDTSSNARAPAAQPQQAPSAQSDDDQYNPTPQDTSPQYIPPPYRPPVPKPRRQPMTVTLNTGTTLLIRLAETLSSDHNYTGDTFRATLESPIIRNGYVIAEKGSKVLGRVASAQRPRLLDGVSDLQLVVTEINTTDGQRVPVETNIWDKKGGSNAGNSAATIAGGAALGAVIGAVAGGGKGAAIGAGAGGAAGTGVALATRARPAVMPVETRIAFHLSAPITITEKLNY